ncbi:hypothetical protein SAMN04487820_101186 [Actinopolyspora mzabensis]|uniref:TAT (Twin-arginine translocation) pathway signal sequence n=1 Tax=Actinopolyspora mzabensis TaxID=995066 RepID=A0A1G8VMK3_ACTMZ|nr:hypothetical protein [Actinopolyspora mzabensis]SDJ67164.1 hypothetical protein SAMN04487820_101186 [Actinopolyspora mzabensis]
MTSIDRRHFFALGGMALGAASLTSLPATALASPATSTWRRQKSVNGWSVLGGNEVERFPVEGSNLSVELAPAAAPVLLYVARRFVYDIESQLQPGEITGHTTDTRVRAPYESTYLSGSGITIRPLFYPVGAKNGFFEEQRIVIRDILADCEGLVAWGGDLDPVKESHFHITAPPTSGRYRALAAKIGGWDDEPGKGAGSINAFAPRRLARARPN